MGVAVAGCDHGAMDTVASPPDAPLSRSVDEPLAARAPQWQVPRVRSDDRLVGGVASGIAEEIGVSPLTIRASFVVLAMACWGILLYGLCWAAMTIHGHLHPVATPVERSPKGANPATRGLGLGLVVAGLLMTFQQVDVGFEAALVWPTALGALGAVVAWDRGVFEAAGQDRALVITRVGVGLGLAMLGLVALVSTNLNRSAAVTAVAVVVVVGTILAVVVGPWAWRTLNALAEERRRRIRSEERAEVAAHLHDSVLQTLALIQRQSDDPQAMVSLARRQERELRDWLFGDDPEPGATVPFRRAIADAAASVEELHHVPINVVTVGDAELADDDRMLALVAAAKEAMTNASRHSGAASIDVFAEVGTDRVEVFVRDTGSGFDRAAVDDDRRGLADSVVGRMARAGGAAMIDSSPGEGTEVTLTLHREAAS